MTPGQSQRVAEKQTNDEVILNINGREYKVSDNVPADTTLNVFIREHALLKGTKFMCLEGGCGVCIVSVKALHPRTKKETSFAINSCMVLVFACHGWSVTTVEGLGDSLSGYHKLQKLLVAGNGTQCGYCSPGMIMNMHSLLESNPSITMKEVENSFGGNICRCTGYRPILDSFKSLASDAPQELVKTITDIEDVLWGKCPKSGEKCSTKCSTKCSSKLVNEHLNLELQDGTKWYRPVTVKEVFEIFDMIGNKSYRYISGNTGQGVYRIPEEPEVYIDLNGIAEIHGSEVRNDGITLGANINLTEAMELFYKLAKEQPTRFTYCKTLADHIDLIANVPVRNGGSFAGNISMKHQNEEFPSDLFLMLEMVNTKLAIADNSGEEKLMPLLEYLTIDMNKKLIVKVVLPALNDAEFTTRSYKIMPRAQNAHAFVNAGFLFKADKNSGYVVQEKPNILFGGINPKFLHAEKTESFLVGKKLLDEKTLKDALNMLENELKPDHILPDATPEFRTGLALSLFYKAILSLAPMAISDRNRSGGSLLERPVSKGIQEFETNRNLWPLTKPIPKLEALLQCSGEAEYTNDMPSFPNQLWGQTVLASRARAKIRKIDPSEALKLPGVVAFFTAKDIPGKNSFVQPAFYVFAEEPIFVDGETDCAGQAVGIIVAESHSLALKASTKVKISYAQEDKIIINPRKIIDDNIEDRIKQYVAIRPTEQKKDIKYKFKGHLDLKHQYHYTMETVSCIANYNEDHLDIYPTSQWPTAVQEAAALALNIPESRINVRVRRLGGGYGGKVTRANHTAIVCSLASYLLRRPVRLVNRLENNMEFAGKRFPVYSNYDGAVNDKGEIQYLNVNFYQDDGYVPNDSCVGYTIEHIKNIYNPSTWDVKGYGVKTDTPSNTWCRAPGSTDGMSIIETIMEHISNVVGLDPITVRLNNLSKEKNEPIPGMIEDLKNSSEFDKRVEEIKIFNKDNRWKKRGISLVPMNYPLGYFGQFNATVTIFGQDGTIAISHGTVEMGQGLNTKAAQVAAYLLGVDVDIVTVKPTDTLMAPNNGPTGGSVGSDSTCYAVQRACEELNRRLEPIKQKLGPNAKWLDIIKQAYQEKLDLRASHLFNTDKDGVQMYYIYGTAVTEVEVDILTGQYHTRRVDLIEDAGQSISPEVDVGQVEGSFVMGMGYYTCEEIVLEPQTGGLLTNRTWNYKPPGAKDIPIDFRVRFRKGAPNPFGVMKAKATGEPPLCLSVSVMFAIRNALESAREEAGNKDIWFDYDPPYTGEKMWLGALTKQEMFTL